MRRWLTISAALLLCSAGSQGETLCTATVADAVMLRLGLPAGTVAQGGFRVRDVVVDHELLRTFVRVERCGQPDLPLTLLPFASVSDVGSQRPAVGLMTVGAQIKSTVGLESTTALTSNTPVVHAGALVSVSMLDARSSVLVRGRLLSSAAVGSNVDVELAALEGSDKPGLRVRGRLLDNERVEVQP